MYVLLRFMLLIAFMITVLHVTVTSSLNLLFTIRRKSRSVWNTLHIKI